MTKQERKLWALRRKVERNQKRMMSGVLKKIEARINDVNEIKKLPYGPDFAFRLHRASCELHSLAKKSTELFVFTPVNCKPHA